ncbi:MAG: hypothetical protein FXF49_00335 [Flexistipes sinusarabici]|uniref:Uncharacterized protein n=1 Tax=Flexistipes sinusarabici TaxID=2352 RepID=A0A5D0MXX9_FLESI|nr:hypothetical protein [Flexistipes sinusarabici]TYB36999.1 MAG: hypothetical protein FXF49_00335 [Flexistipes sinusarabici]
MNGRKVTKTGNYTPPGLLYTFTLCMRLIFFSDKAFFELFNDKRLTYNLITIFLLMLTIPIKVFTTEKIILFNPGKFVENILLSLIFISFLYLLIPKKETTFTGYLRVFLGFEVVDIFGAVTLLLSGQTLDLYTALLLGWYLSLAVYAVAKIAKLEYVVGFMLVFFAFLVTNFVPVFLGN